MPNTKSPTPASVSASSWVKDFLIHQNRQKFWNQISCQKGKNLNEWFIQYQKTGLFLIKFCITFSAHTFCNNHKWDRKEGGWEHLSISFKWWATDPGLITVRTQAGGTNSKNRPMGPIGISLAETDLEGLSTGGEKVGGRNTSDT